MRNIWKAVVIASSLVGPVALADGDDWEAPSSLVNNENIPDWELQLRAMDDWEAPNAVKAMDDWEAPNAVKAMDDWEAPNAVKAMDDWEAPNAVKAMDDWEAPNAVKAMDDWEAPNAIKSISDWELQVRGAFPVIVVSMDDWESPVSIAPSNLSEGGEFRLESSACLRVAAMPWRPLAARAAVPVLGFVNVCGAERWQSAELIDAAFMDAYVRMHDGRLSTRAHVYQDAAGSHGLLYNFRLGRWEEKAFVAR